MRQEQNQPNLYLIGHNSQPTYAIGWSSVKPILASGSKDGSIHVWNLEANINAAKGFHVDSLIQPKNEGQLGKEGVRVCKQTSSVNHTRKTRGNADSQVESVLMSDESGEQEMDESSDMEVPKQGKQKNLKTLQRITKNIANYLNEPKPDKNKNS